MDDPDKYQTPKSTAEMCIVGLLEENARLKSEVEQLKETILKMIEADAK
jgi:hypothetical protein